MTVDLPLCAQSVTALMERRWEELADDDRLQIVVRRRGDHIANAIKSGTNERAQILLVDFHRETKECLLRMVARRMPCAHAFLVTFERFLHLEKTPFSNDSFFPTIRMAECTTGHPPGVTRAMVST